MSKARRIVRRALLPYTNSPVMLNASTGLMTAAQITQFKNLVLSNLDAGMKNPGENVAQISGRTCTINPNQNILANDELIIDWGLVPVGCSTAINCTEHFATTTAG
jgi:hypothetical protein